MDEVIANYRAQIPARDREAIGGFVADCVRDLQPTSVGAARYYLTTLTRHVQWCWQRGYLLDREVIFRHELIADYIAVGRAGTAVKTQATDRTRLFAASDRLLTGPGRRLPLAPLSPQASLSPYSERELIALRSWALHQRTEYKRVNATMLLALGLGAGLSARELCGVRAEHVTVDDDGVLVDVTAGNRLRTVPLLAHWEGPIAALARASMRGGQYVFMPRRKTTYHRSQISNFVADTSSVPFPITANRLRVTWIVHHLTMGTPAKVLATAAGYTSTTALGQYLGHVPDLSLQESRGLLRGDPGGAT